MPGSRSSNVEDWSAEAKFAVVVEQEFLALAFFLAAQGFLDSATHGVGCFGGGDNALMLLVFGTTERYASFETFDLLQCVEFDQYQFLSVADQWRHRDSAGRSREDRMARMQRRGCVFSPVV